MCAPHLVWIPPVFLQMAWPLYHGAFCIFPQLYFLSVYSRSVLRSSYTSERLALLCSSQTIILWRKGCLCPVVWFRDLSWSKTEEEPKWMTEKPNMNEKRTPDCCLRPLCCLMTDSDENSRANELFWQRMLNCGISLEFWNSSGCYDSMSWLWLDCF